MKKKSQQKKKNIWPSVLTVIAVILLVGVTGFIVLQNMVHDVSFYNGYCYDKLDGNYTFTIEDMKYIGDEYRINQIQQIAQCKDGFILLQLENVIS